MDTQSQIAMSEKDLDNFVSKLLEESGKSFLSEEEREKAREELRDEVEAKVEKALLEALPDKFLEQVYEEFKKDETESEKIAEILRESKVDVAGVIKVVLDGFRGEYLGGKNE